MIDLNTRSEQGLILWDVLFRDGWHICINTRLKVESDNPHDVMLCSGLIPHSSKFHVTVCREGERRPGFLNPGL